MGGRGSGSGIGGGKSTVQQQMDAIHKYQQVSHEGISQSDRQALRDYIDSNPDIQGSVSRGLVVDQSTINRWLNEGEINMNGLNSWSDDGSVASRFAEVTRHVDADDGKRSAIIVSEGGLPNSAKLPRTNSYKESEVLTYHTKFKIEGSRVQTPYTGSNNKSPTETIIFVKPL